MDGSASGVALTVVFMDSTYLRQGKNDVVTIIRIILTILFSRFYTAQLFKSTWIALLSGASLQCRSSLSKAASGCQWVQNGVSTFHSSQFFFHITEVPH